MTYSNGCCSINSQNWKDVDILALSSLHSGYTDRLLRRLVRYFATKHCLVFGAAKWVFFNFYEVWCGQQQMVPASAHLEKTLLALWHR
jgi:hypothetical protein